MNLRAILLVSSFVPPLLPADTLVKLETATPIEIYPSCARATVALVPDEKSTIHLGEGPQVELVFLGASPRDAGKFASSWTGKQFPRTIQIVLDPDQTRQAGTYDLYLNLQPTSAPGAGRLKIQLTRPAAAVDAIPKLIIDRTFGCMGLCPDSHPPLRLTENTKKSGITISAVRPVTNASIGTEPVSGTLEFTPQQPEVKPGEQVKLDYRPAGRFGLGTATGTMRIDAPQLATPVAFDYEVRSRVHWIYIGITIVVGLIISYLVKVRLQQTIEFDQAHLDAAKLLERITQEAVRHADPAFSAAYRNELATLNAAMNGGNANDINTAKVALDTVWHTALQALAKRHQDQLDALDKLRDITNYDWLVPPAVSQAIVMARTAQAEVLQLIEGDNLTQADVQRRQTILDLGNRIRTEALKWQTDQQQVLNGLAAATTGISTAILAPMAKPVTDLLAALHKVDATTQLATPEQIQQTLSDLKFERTSVQQFFDWLSNTLQMEAATAEAQIPHPPPASWDAAIFAQAPAGVVAFTTFLKTMPDHPDPAALPPQLATLSQAWNHALQSQFAALNALVQAQLEVANYVEATKVTLQQRTMAAAMAAAPGGPAGRAFTAPEFHRDPVGAAALPIYAIRTRFQTIAMAAPVLRTPVTDAAKLRRDKMLQSLVLGVLLIVGGYGLQLSTFVGTFTDFSTLFFWAFALDLTVDQVGRVVKKT
jgi:hypothetical protein